MHNPVHPLMMCFAFQLDTPLALKPSEITNKYLHRSFTQAKCDTTAAENMHSAPQLQSPMITVPYPITDEAAKCLFTLDLLHLKWRGSSEFKGMSFFSYCTYRR